MVVCKYSMDRCGIDYTNSDNSYFGESIEYFVQ